MLISGGPRELLVRGAWLSAPLGLWTLASLLGGQPLTFRVTRTMLPRRAELMDRLWAADVRSGGRGRPPRSSGVG